MNGRPTLLRAQSGFSSLRSWRPIAFPCLITPDGDAKSFAEAQKRRTHAETDQKVGKVVNNAVERDVDGVEVERARVKARAAKRPKRLDAPQTQGRQSV